MGDETRMAQAQEAWDRQGAYFATHETFDVSRRVQALRRLYDCICDHEQDMAEALRKDLGKSHDESYMCEIGLSLDEIRYQIAHVRSWSRPRRRPTHLANFAARSYTVAEPYGRVLIMAPWNYPFLLTLEPLAGAIAAGNCVILKPSAYAPASSALLAEIVAECFDPQWVTVIEGGRAENAALLDMRWDYIFFTGSVAVGRLVMEKASRNLTPVSLELGGKSPCIVTADANLKVAAARLAFGKWLNCGQTCVAPDYLLVDERVHDKFIPLVEEEVAKMYGVDAFANPNYGRMVNEKHFMRVGGLIDPDKVVHGGRLNEATLQIEPTILDGVEASDDVMGEEIFGPLLPVISYSTLDEAEAFIREREKPLALYVFTSSRETEQRFMRNVAFGGGCVNDTIIHLATSEMGFGGVGNSGMGSYHGRESFRTFSHEKSIVKKYTWLDLPFRYQPYSSLKQRMVRLFVH